MSDESVNCELVKNITSRTPPSIRLFLNNFYDQGFIKIATENR